MQTNGFIKHNNINIIKVTKEECIAEAIINENSLNPYNIIHGGLIFSLGDTVTGYHAKLFNGKSLTLDAQIDFLRHGKSEKIIAKSKMIKCGKSTIILTANIYDLKNTLIAIMKTTYFFIK